MLCYVTYFFVLGTALDDLGSPRKN